MNPRILGLAGILLAVGTVAVTAQRGPVPRQFNSQQKHYIRWTFNYNSCLLASGTCNVKVGAVPYNAFLSDVYQQVITSFNSGTTDTLALGVTATGDELVTAQSVHGAAAAATVLTLAGGGETITGNGAAQTGSNGGFDIFTHYVQTGSAPTAGQAILVLEYFAPNDGSCTAVGPGATATGC